MRVRLASLVMGGLAAATLGLSFAAPSAFASPQHPAASTAHARPGIAHRLSGLTIVENSNSNYAVLSNGVQNTATINDLNQSTWSNSQQPDSVWWNASGNCLREKTDHTVEISTSCSGDAASEWTWESNGTHYRLQNGQYDNFMGTTCISNGCYVKGEPNTGAYYLVAHGDGY